MSDPSIKKRLSISIETKKAVLDEAESGVTNKSELARRFNLNRNSVADILKNKRAILDAISFGKNVKRARLRAPKYAELEKVLMLWLKQVRSQDVPVTGPIIKKKAIEIANNLNILDFSASEGWLSRFKERHSIVFKSIQGESGSTDVTSLIDWHHKLLKPEIDEFSQDDIFKIDETGLFFRMLPNNTLEFRNEKCYAGENSKERITILFGANMNGKEKLPLLIIGKSKNPRCFNNKKLPENVQYFANSKTWMTSEIFEKWLTQWDKELSMRKVLLYLDTCPSHTNIPLKNITLKFLPQNSDSLPAPSCNHGIIQSFKCFYRRNLLKHKIDSIDSETDFNISLLHAINFADCAWQEVTQLTISNCFNSDSLISELALLHEHNGDDHIQTYWDRLQYQGEIELNIPLCDYLTIDDSLVTEGVFSIEEIIEEERSKKNNLEDISEGDDNVEIETIEIIKEVTLPEAMNAMRTLELYLQNYPKALEIFYKLDEEMLKSCEEMKQSKIEDYFSSSNNLE
ncbi:hypothetical protein ACQ4LE_004546 [Meloidogyne hapla]|uniref:HTH CENPB-type domain-containing protein n=1 Tax=Meloidogyne hapla TaxID=6305 RepID=A0A1I8BZD2_MELHA